MGNNDADRFFNVLTIQRPRTLHACDMKVVESRRTEGGRVVREIACECGGRYRQLERANVARRRGARV